MPIAASSITGDGKIKIVGDSGNIADVDSDGNLCIKVSGGAATDCDTYTCPVGVAVGDMVYISASDTVDKAKADAEATTHSIGVVKSKPDTTTAEVQRDGKSSVFSGLTVGNPVWLSETTAGGVTQTPPTGAGGDEWLQMLGVAAKTDTIALEIDQPIGLDD